MLKNNDTLFHSISREHYGEVEDTVRLVLRFSAVTEYCDPNYENIYPEEYVVPIDELCFNVAFGECYVIRVSGNNINGYRATLT